MFKKDCFAFIKEGNCFALTEMQCSNCSFYKSVPDGPTARKKIIEETDCAAKLKSLHYNKKFNS